MNKTVKVNDLIDDYYNAYYLVVRVDDDMIYYRECVTDEDDENILHVYGSEEIISKDEFDTSENWKVIERNEQYTVIYE